MAERPTGVARRVAWSATLTVVALAMFETLAQLGGWLPEPVGLLALIVVSCAFVGGSQGGLASAALCVIFAVTAGPLGSRMFPMDEHHFARASIAAYALPALALLVGALRIQAQNRLGRYNRVRAEADALDQRYREIIEGLGGTCWQIGLPDHDVQFVSHNAAELYGFALTRWLDGSRIWDELLHPDDSARVRAAFDAAADAGRPLEVAHRVVTRSGETLRVHSILQARSDENRPRAVVHGVTVRAPAPTVDEVGRAVFEDLPDPVLVYGLDGRIVEANPAACAALGYTREELLGLPLGEIGLDRTSGAAGPTPAVLRRKDGRTLATTLRALPLPRGDRTLTVVHAAGLGAAA